MAVPPPAMTDQQQPHWQLEKEFSTITTPSDLVLRVVEHHNIASLEGSTTVVRLYRTKIHEFRVDLATLAGASAHFNSLLEQQPEVLEIDENDAGNVTGLATWLKIIHYMVTPDTYGLHLYEIWYVCSVAEKYGFDPRAEKAVEWFDSWYNNQPNIGHFNFRDYEQLVYPTMLFDHATGFGHTTKYLAYRSNGIISEVQPEGFRAENAYTIRTNPAVMHQINAARHRLTTVFHRALYAPISTLLSGTTCDCTPFILFSYEKALTKTGCWPLHPALEKMSIKAVIEAFAEFELIPVRTCGKEKCSRDLRIIVEKAVNEIEQQFAGLCLDCMDSSTAETGTAGYWHRETFGVAWDNGCRINHTQPSWFFSFMGDRTEMNEYLQNKSRERANSYGRERPSSYGYGNNAFPRGGAVGRGGITRGVPRPGARNSQRPGRNDSLLSRPYYPGGMVQDATTQLANFNMSEGQN